VLNAGDGMSTPPRVMWKGAMALTQRPTGNGLDDIDITDLLVARRSAPAREGAEVRALHELAKTMVATPEALMDRLVELAVQLCGAQSGGISLYEPTPEGPGIFRWYGLKGLFAPYSGATTPRDNSPCGVVLDRQMPVLVKSPQRYYPYLALDGAMIEEGLLVPLNGSNDSASGTLWVVSHDPDHAFSVDDSETLTRLAAFAAAGLTLTRTVSQKNELLAQKDALVAEQQMMLREVNHRVSNSLQLANSILRLQARQARSEEARQALSEAVGRVASIRLIHTRLYQTGNMAAIALDQYMRDLCSNLAASVRSDPAAEQVPVNVVIPDGLALPPDVVTKLGLVVNELLTNAFKHAAQASHREVAFIDRRDTIELVVSDNGPGLPDGFDVHNQKGLGMRMVLSLVDQLKGHLITTSSPSGAQFLISLPKEALKPVPFEAPDKGVRS
jgi:two-component sensor histidine kinase